MIENSQSKHNNHNHICPHKFAFMLDNWVRKLFQNPAKILKEYITPGDTVIDMGCGPGFFTIEIANMVGNTGRVIAVDLQKEMLARVSKKAARKGVTDRVAYHRCDPDRIGLDQKADFILAYYVVHETPDPGAFLKEAKTLLNEGGRLLVVEPKMHVSRAAFEEIVEDGKTAGLRAVDSPPKKGGHSVLFAPLPAGE